MAKQNWRELRVWMPVVVLAGTWLSVGCRMKERVVEPAVIANPAMGPMSIAVAPALNQSGSTDFDADRFADLMAGELSYADGVSVIPVSRVLAVLAAQRMDGVESPTHALEIVQALGVDAILVFSVTEYDPYDPPSIGITAQLYGTRPGQSGGTVDPVTLSRQAALAASSSGRVPRGLIAQTQGVFDASHDSVVRDVRHYASYRRGEQSPYGWRKYVVSQQHFIRYCCYATIKRLMGWQDVTELADGDPREVRKP